MSRVTNWLELSVLICLTGELATAESKRLCHRLLHTAVRIIYHGRRIRLHLQAESPWAPVLVAAFARLRAIQALC
jgi:hypothetical protein